MSLLPPGSKVTYMGEEMTVGMVGITGGERYYWLVAEDNSVAMIPASYVEHSDTPEGGKGA